LAHPRAPASRPSIPTPRSPAPLALPRVLPAPPRCTLLGPPFSRLHAEPPASSSRRARDNYLHRTVAPALWLPWRGLRSSHPCPCALCQPRRRCVAAWCISRPTDQRARARHYTWKLKYRQHVRVVSVYPLPAYSLSFVYPSLCLPSASPPWCGGPVRLAWCSRCDSLRGLPTVAPAWPLRYPDEPASRTACPAAP
jgi:hypothetical protein